MKRRGRRSREQRGQLAGPVVEDPLDPAPHRASDLGPQRKDRELLAELAAKTA
jgi:hypothetical protein